MKMDSPWVLDSASLLAVVLIAAHVFALVSNPEGIGRAAPKENALENHGGEKREMGESETDPNSSFPNPRLEKAKGLIPRAKLLLTIGGTFFLGFWPLILVTIAFFSALYLYFGPSFVHDASKIPTGPPPYIDPYTLLEDERLSQTAPHVK